MHSCTIVFVYDFCTFVDFCVYFVGVEMASISAYLHEFSNSLGFGSVRVSPNRREVLFFDLDFCVGDLCVLVGFGDGWVCVYHVPDRRVLYSKRFDDPIVYMRLDGRGNLVYTTQGDDKVANFISLMGENNVYHVIRLTSKILSIKVNCVCIAIASGGGRMFFYDVATLQETFSVQNNPLGVLALGSRWVAYNLSPQQSSPGHKFKHVWNTLTGMGQDAFDNIVIAIGGASTPSVGSPVATSNCRNSLIGIRDVLSMKVIALIEDVAADNNRPIEGLDWSKCGSLLITTSGNGHVVHVYRPFVGAGPLTFELVYSLNRGITPAVITSLAVCANSAAVASAKGTVHIFQSGCGKYQKSAGTHLTYDFDNCLVVGNVNDLTVDTGSGESVQIECPTEDILFAVLEKGHNNRNQVCSVELDYCALAAVPFWKSPLIEFPTTNLPLRGKSHGIANALNSTLNIPQTRDKYQVSSNDGFLQIVSVIN